MISVSRFDGLPPGEEVGWQAEIERCAYRLWERRGRRHGFDLEDWLEAEQRAESESREIEYREADEPLSIRRENGTCHRCLDELFADSGEDNSLSSASMWAHSQILLGP